MIILTGHPKTGNTWCRFVIFNYWNILKNNATETLTYQELIDINNQIWEGSEEYPQVYFTHKKKNLKGVRGRDWTKKGRVYNKTNKIIYIIRNPFDTMVSYFYYMTNRDDPFNGHYKERLTELLTLEGFVHYFLPQYIDHVKSVLPYASVIVKYEHVRNDPSRFFNVLKFVYGTINENIAKKAIELSSFENIKQMGNTSGRPYGLASSYKGQFTRDGRVGQYEEIMSKELIEYIKKECDKNGIKYE